MKMLSKGSLLSVAFLLLAFVFAPVAAEDVTLEFAQWWEPELPAGEFRALMEDRKSTRLNSSHGS